MLTLMSSNRISELPSEIGQMKCLKELYLAGNELTVLPDTLSDMKGALIVQIPSSMAFFSINLPGLELIDCRHNNICYLPPALRALNFLEKIDMGDNPTFPLPPELLSKKTLTIETNSSKINGRFSVAKAEMKGTLESFRKKGCMTHQTMEFMPIYQVSDGPWKTLL